ncbi:uncharacterized protein LOC114578493 [Dendrobium catenatum]|uniref:uncharacterized protein LOC114578493 n=1 Tax=Dendrobium catenatum TaxID=906689 RepID=UPI0010A08F4D|nr:uncharacterized protein LOC114578493 [Dendrobium catenatum]
MEEEFSALTCQGTWSLVPPPEKLQFSVADGRSDKIIANGNDQSSIEFLLTTPVSLSLKQLGNVSLFLGIQILNTPSGYLLNQRHYALKILQDVGLHDCSTAPTPITPNRSAPVSDDKPFVDPHLYHKIAGSLQYMSITRPNIPFRCKSHFQHMHAPTDRHFQLLKRLLRYIKRSLNYGLPISSAPTENLSQDSAPSWQYLIPGPSRSKRPLQSRLPRKNTITVAAASDVLWAFLVEELAPILKVSHHIYCDNTSAIAWQGIPFSMLALNTSNWTHHTFFVNTLTVELSP